jgi:hypothetical protein
MRPHDPPFPEKTLSETADWPPSPTAKPASTQH